jgi:hypothetical protein
MVGRMLRIPTEVGDVLILRTEQTFSIHAIEVVTKAGQQDCRGQVHVTYVRNDEEALTEARAMCVPGRRIFILDIDSGDWSQISS